MNIFQTTCFFPRDVCTWHFKILELIWEILNNYIVTVKHVNMNDKNLIKQKLFLYIRGSKGLASFGPLRGIPNARGPLHIIKIPLIPLNKL